MQRKSLGRIAAAGLAASLLVALSACTDDDKDKADDDDTPPTTEADEPTDDGALSAAGCDAYAAFGASFMGDPAAIVTAGETLAGALPASLEASGTAITEGLAAGEEGMASPEFFAAVIEIGDAAFAGCEAEKVEVDGVDYGFEGLPEQLEAGRVAFKFTNKTANEEPHELTIMRRNDGVTEPIDEILALPQDEVMSKLTPAGMAYAETPDSSNVVLTDLEPGSYVAVCMIPVGGAEDGAPHALHGMVAEFEVA